MLHSQFSRPSSWWNLLQLISRLNNNRITRIIWNGPQCSEGKHFPSCSISWRISWPPRKQTSGLGLLLQPWTQLLSCNLFASPIGVALVLFCTKRCWFKNHYWIWRQYCPIIRDWSGIETTTTASSDVGLALFVPFYTKYHQLLRLSTSNIYQLIELEW